MYADFLAAKAPAAPPVGMQDVPSLPATLKPFQRALTGWALRRGRAALFEGTGLGKTLQQLSWARAVADYETAPVLVLTPLAVAEQTVAEAAKFGISGVAYAPDRYSVRGEIVVTNYERFDKFNIADFAGEVADVIRSYGWEPDNDNVSDALAILLWAESKFAPKVRRSPGPLFAQAGAA